MHSRDINVNNRPYGRNVKFYHSFLQHTEYMFCFFSLINFTITINYIYLLFFSGKSYRPLSCQFRISHNLLSSIIPSVSKTIYAVLQSLYVKLPNTEEEWLKVAAGFSTQWQFPLCIRALDGKRILFKSLQIQDQHSMIIKGTAV